MADFLNTALPKLCHARIDQQVRLPDPKTGQVLPEVFLVICSDQGLGHRKLKPGREGMPHGLYDEERKLMLLSLETFTIKQMPHLSSRAELLSEKGKASTTVMLADALANVDIRGLTVLSILPAGAEMSYQLEVDTLKPLEVLKAFNLLAAMDGTLLSIENRGLKAAWQADVAAGRCELSYKEFEILALA